MDDKNLLLYLSYFLKKEVNLNNEKDKLEIDNNFGWQVFLKKLQILIDDNLVFENSECNSYTLTQKGNIKLAELKSELEFENVKKNAKLESLKTSTDVNKFLLQTKWLPHFIAILSLLFSIYTYFDTQNDSKKIEERINKLENKSKTFLNK